MANNPYVNKVQLADGTTVMDISDTTADASDVEQGKYFYNAAGAKVMGTSSVGNSKTYYGTSDTASATAQKEVTIADLTELTAGVAIRVKFTHENTASNPTLKVNSLAAAAIYRSTSAAGNASNTSWTDGSVVTMTYDGSHWVINNFNNTVYSTMTVAEYEAGTGTGARVVTPARLKAAIQYHAIPQPSSPATGAFLVYDGSDWVAQTLSTWQGGSY